MEGRCLFCVYLSVSVFFACVEMDGRGDGEEEGGSCGLQWVAVIVCMVAEREGGGVRAGESGIIRL